MLICALFASGCLAAADVADDFYQAIRRDDSAAVAKLLQASGPDVKDNRGNTPLMYAAAVGSEAMMRRLIDAGADVKAKNSFDATALHWSGNSLARIQMLVEKGADVNARSKQGHTPLYVAAAQAGGLPAVQYLVSKGAALIGPPAAEGMTPLAAASYANDTATVRFLVEKGGKPVLAPPGGPMAIMNAAFLANRETLKLLLDSGVDVNSVSPAETERVKNGPIGLGSLTPLILAVAAGDTEIVRMLLAAGAKTDAQDVRGMTPLMLAVATDHPNHDIVKMLLARNPDLRVKSKAGETVLDWALKFRQPTVLSAVGASGARPPIVPTSAGAANTVAAMQKSVALLQSSAATGFKEGGCISCHGGNIVTSAVAAARRKGVRADDAVAAEMLKGTRLFFASQAESLLERNDGPAVEIFTFVLAALADEGVQPDRITDALVYNIAAQQLAEGHWPYRGIVRPPTADHIFTNTAFAIRAFKQYAPPARKREYDERIARAARAIAAAQATTTEDRVMQALGLKWAGESAKAQSLLKGITALQREDGGWAQTQHLSTDAYATATALNALFECGVSPQSPEYRKGVAFLLKTQAADGSWHVASRAPKFQPYFEGGFPYGHDQWISQWATGWATIALSHSLPQARAAR
jgi:ankyrin repeat protein